QVSVQEIQPMRPRYIAFQTSVSERPVVALDIGYSAKRRTCGVASPSNPDGKCWSFSEALEQIGELLSELPDAVLVIEAPLSSMHVNDGNPGIRGEFEKGRGWYCGPGAVSYVAAARFLGVLHRRLPKDAQVSLAEAFLSNKTERTNHAKDASIIARGFW